MSSEPKPLLLLVDDDPKFRGTMRSGLSECGFETDTAVDVEEALERLETTPRPYDLVLLDVMMPGRAGWELLEELRARGAGTPVIFLTARHGVDERIKGLRLGAEDYVVKPFAFAELVARIDVVLRRRRKKAEAVLGDLRIDFLRRTVDRGGRRIELSPREFDLLQVFANEPGRTFSRAELLREVWGIAFDPGTNVVTYRWPACAGGSTGSSSRL